MKKFLVLLLVLLPIITLAKTTTDYTQLMKGRLLFSLNRDQQAYDKLVEKTKTLSQAGQPVAMLNQKLLETKAIIDRASTSLSSLVITSTSTWHETRQKVRTIVADIRLAHVKIRWINRIILNYGK